MRDRSDPETRELVEAFERCTLPGLDHAAHVRVAWHYLTCEPLPIVLQKLPPRIRRFAESKGATQKYHETMTYAFTCLIHERLARTPSCSWQGFRDRHPDLLNSALLRRYYSADVLDSAVARTVFVFPEPAFPDAS